MDYYRIISSLKIFLLNTFIQRHKGLFAFVASLFFATFLCATASRLEVRDAIIANEQHNIEAKMKKQVKSLALGEWKTIIDDSLFSLIRRTELYRGKVSVTVYEDDLVRLSVLPDLSVFISSGLLGYVDEAIFLSLSDNLRRAKNINEERELYLSAFLAFELARFAVDLDVSKYQRSPFSSLDELSKRLLPSDFFLLDEMAASLLKVAGYGSDVMASHLERLQQIMNGTFASSYFFDEFLLKNLYARSKRIEDVKENIEQFAEEVLSVLFALNGQQNLGELVQSLELLEAVYPNSLYLLRLKTLASHSLYMESFDVATLEFVPFLPLAVLGHVYAKKYYLPLEKNFNESHPSPSKDTKKWETLQQEAIAFYKEYLVAIRDESMASSYLALLASRLFEKQGVAKGKEIAKAMLGEKDIVFATSLLQGNTNLINVEKLNYAFFIDSLNMNNAENAVATEKNTLASILQDALERGEERCGDGFLKKGHFFDERLILYNHILASKKVGKNKKDLQSSIATLKKKAIVADKKKTISIRQLKIGESTDELTRLWGEPSSIVYNYYFERWIYNHLKAMAVISSYAENPAVMEIILFSKSPVSLQGNIRIGDDRKTFETQFGSPSYKAGDCDVYFYGKESLCVLYSAGNIIKSIFIFHSTLKDKVSERE